MCPVNVLSRETGVFTQTCISWHTTYVLPILQIHTPLVYSMYKKHPPHVWHPQSYPHTQSMELNLKTAPVYVSAPSPHDCEYLPGRYERPRKHISHALLRSIIITPSIYTRYRKSLFNMENIDAPSMRTAAHPPSPTAPPQQQEDPPPPCLPAHDPPTQDPAARTP